MQFSNLWNGKLNLFLEDHFKLRGKTQIVSEHIFKLSNYPRKIVSKNFLRLAKTNADYLIKTELFQLIDFPVGLKL